MVKSPSPTPTATPEATPAHITESPIPTITAAPIPTAAATIPMWDKTATPDTTKESESRMVY